MKRGGEKNKTAQKLALWKRCDDIPCCLRSLGTDSTGIWDKGSAICRQVVKAKKKKAKTSANGKKNGTDEGKEGVDEGKEGEDEGKEGEDEGKEGENEEGKVDGGDANSDLGGKVRRRGGA